MNSICNFCCWSAAILLGLKPKSQNQCFGSGFIDSGSGSSILGWVPIRIQSRSRVLMTKNWKKCKAGKKFAIYLTLGLHKGRPSYRRSLQPSKDNIQHFKTWNFLTCLIFLFLWVIFALLEPDPDSDLGSGSIDPIESGSGSETLPKTTTKLTQKHVEKLTSARLKFSKVSPPFLGDVIQSRPKTCHWLQILTASAVVSST